MRQAQTSPKNAYNKWILQQVRALLSRLPNTNKTQHIYGIAEHFWSL